MSQWNKLLERIRSMSNDLRFDELKRILESYGYEMKAPKSGGSHYTFRKRGCHPITVPKHGSLKKVYVKMVKDIVESEQVMKKTIDEYMSVPYRMEIVEDKDEGGFVVSFPQLPGCLSVGDTIEAALSNAQDAKKAWIEAAIHDNIEIKETDDLKNYSGQFKLRLPRSLHKTLAEHSRKEGVSMNQYCVYLLSIGDISHFMD